MTVATPRESWPSFRVPAEREATLPPERRGIPRDGVRLLVSRRRRLSHHRFHDLPSLLRRGDLLVVNTSATLPAALDAVRADGVRVPVHVSSPLPSGDWVVEVRRQDNGGPDPIAHGGMELTLPDGGTLRLVEPYPGSGAVASRLWRAQPPSHLTLTAYLAAHGRPIRYGHTAVGLPLIDYQNVYAGAPGSAEMASAGRPFTAALLVSLAAAGIVVAGITLHAGVSSPEVQEAPYAERFAVPGATARLVSATRRSGGRVVAVGTTVVRALETAAAPDGSVSAAEGWTELVLDGRRRPRAVSGLITGLHLPASSHLRLLEAVAGAEAVRAAYAAALDEGYLWHEFGDSMLFLP